ncbi:hypothetical protein FF1_018868 [Malus domestica]
MVVANSCPMEKRAQSKPSKASTAMPATATEKKLKDFEVCLDVRKLEIEIELNSKRFEERWTFDWKKTTN